MSLRKWSLVAAPLAFLSAAASAQTPPPPIPVPPVGTAPPPSQPVSATPVPASRPPVPVAAAAPVPPPAVPPAPGAPGAPAPGMPGQAAGLPGAVPPPPVPLLGAAPEPKVARAVGPDEAEVPRAEYRARLVACLNRTPRCSFGGLTPGDRDYIRYDLRGQRYDAETMEDIASNRMRQFTNDTSADVIVPKMPERASPVPTERVTTVENASNAEGYAIAVTTPDGQGRAAHPRRARRAEPRQMAPDWW